MEKNKELIIDNIYNWVNTYMPGFTFRQYQLEYIAATIYAILNNEELIIIEAPTGSGKSILVMIMAGVLDKHYHKKSYILCSDLYLWQQYSDAIDNYNLYFGRLKGAVGNYVCNVSGNDLSIAPCRLAMIPYTNLFSYEFCMNTGWLCAIDCDYIKERRKAITASVTLMTYQLYLQYMNIGGDSDVNLGKERPFKNRDIIFCDECHNIPNICQEYSTIVLDENKDIEKITNLLEFCASKDIVLDDGTHAKDIDIDDYIKKLHEMYNDLQQCDYRNQTNLISLLKDYSALLYKYAGNANNPIKEMYLESAKKGHTKKVSKKEHKAIEEGRWAYTLYNAIEGYCANARQHGEQYVVKTDNRVMDMNTREMVWPANPIVMLKYAKEDTLCYNSILKHQPNNVMLSATIGDKITFDDNIGAKFLAKKASLMYRIPSTFDFSKSPIYFINGNKMSQDYIQQSFPINANIINSILKSDKHINEKGIIHTGSYKNAYELLKYLDNDVKKRIHIYNSAKEKQDVLLDYEDSRNGVLVGPTLTEGIDFPEDGCRFIIILKIPYPYLGDNLVKAKNALFPRWYNSETSKNVIQGIGRGNRTPTDWSTTYILDGCFSSLYQSTHLQYPDEMKSRIKLIHNDLKK